MKRVVVIGFLSNQAQEIDRRYGHRCKLRFYESDQNLQQLSSVVSHADVVFMNTKFISHKHSRCVKHANVVEFYGGISSLCRVLEERI